MYEQMISLSDKADLKQRALERIIQLYEAWDAAEPGQGHADRATEWRAKLPATQPVAEPRP